MRKTLLAMADGKFAYEQDELIISERRLEFICNADEIIEGKFSIKSNAGVDLKGVLYTTNYRMSCRNVQFAGKNVEIEYVFNARGLDYQTTIKGDIFIETNIGEYNLPFVVTVLKDSVPAAFGTVRNLFHFANLAHTDFEQAYKLFVSNKFRNINMENSEKIYYKMLVSHNPCREHMEEFLLAVNKKKPVSIQLEEHSFEEKYEGENFSKIITVKKSGWGLLKIDVSADAEFVKLEKTKIYMDDFFGNQIDYTVVIDGEYLHAGNNYARINFKTDTQEETFEITVRCTQKERTDNWNEIKNLRIKLCQLYIQVRTHAIHNLSWIRESLNLLENLMSFVSDNKFLELFHAQLLILDKKSEDASYIINKFKKDRQLKKNEPEVYAYLLYVEALSRQQEEVTIKALSEIRSLMENNPGSDKIFWALLFLDDELQKNPSQKYKMLREQFEFGCRSPFLYLETFLLLKTDETLMSEINSFEKQVLSFALHQGLITEQLAVFAAKVSLKCRGYNALLLRLLKNFYHLFENNEIVEAVCSQLIKGGFRDRENFYWYELGITAELKLNLLFEYYLYTIPTDKKEILPKSVLLYFSYNHNVDYRHKAYLYANIMRYKENIEGVFEKYEPYISQFVEEQLLKRRVSEDLMFLYELYMDSLIEKEECCDILEELIFTCVIECSKEKMRRVIVSYDELKKFDEFVFTDRKAFVRIYTDAAFIAVEDKSGKLHFETVDFEIKPLLNRSKISKYSNLLKKKNVGILLNRYKKSGIILEKTDVSVCMKLMNMEDITDEFKEELLGRLIGIYEDIHNEEMVVNLLCKLDFDIIEPVKRAAYFEKMIIYGMYDEVYELIFRYGFEHIKTKRLVRLCSRKITDGCDEDRLVTLCGYVFLSGKYDEVMLNYLASEYYGTTYDMIKLWSAAKNFELDSYKICERLLVQMLYTGFMPGKTTDIFEDYCSNAPKTEVVTAYISYLSYHYVVNKQVVEDGFFEHILKISNKKEYITDYARLAYIKFCSEKEKLNDAEKEFIRESVKVLEKKGIIFDFMKKAGRRAGFDSNLYEKTVIEYLANPANKVVLYYRILDDSSGETEFIREELRAMFGPMFVKEVTMFYGEALQYYIVERGRDGNERFTCSCIIQKEPDDFELESGRYWWINEMYISHSLKDEATLLNIMKQYDKYRFIIDKLFELKE